MSRDESTTDFETWFDRINRQLEQASRQFGPASSIRSAVGGQPDLDLVDRGDEFVVTIDLPGYTNDAVTAKLTDRTLFVEAQREGVEETATEGAEDYIHMERRHESVSRRIRLPEAIDRDDVTARMNNGVLTVSIGKAEPAGAAIEIE